MKTTLFLALSLALLVCCKIPTVNFPKEGDTKGKELEALMKQITLPKGFKIELYASEIDNARSMTLGSNGTLFVGTRDKGIVYALVDSDNDNKADQTYVLAKGLNMPNGVAFSKGDLYVAEVNRILKFSDIENQLGNPPPFEVVFDQLPSDRHHGWKFIAFGPDQKLYIPIGAPCNICHRKEEVYASISRMNPDGTGFEVYAKGVRNSVGFDWHPQTGDLWFTENGRDMMGDDLPPCEINRATSSGMHFGFPFCHGADISDPKFGDERACSEFTPPAQNLNAHVAPLGIRFIKEGMFPQTYVEHIIFAEHGSWNRSKKSGYQLSLCRLEGNEVSSYEPFATGWLNPETQDVWGRPVDVLHLSDGSLLVSDDFADAIYRIVYEKK